MEKIHGHNRRGAKRGARSPFIHIVTVAEERSSSITSHFRRFTLGAYLFTIIWLIVRNVNILLRRNILEVLKRKYKSGTKKPMVKLIQSVINKNLEDKYAYKSSIDINYNSAINTQGIFLLLYRQLI